MANGHGGYRKPEQPAAVSGPGKYSKRTDGKPGETMQQAKHYLSGGGEYGASKELNDIQAGAPLAAGIDPSNIIGFDSPSERPDEPVTAGAALGPGRNSLSIYPPEQSNDEMSPVEIMSLLFEAYAADPSTELLYAIKRAGEDD